jgi:hypothetical protein
MDAVATVRIVSQHATDLNTSKSGFKGCTSYGRHLLLIKQFLANPYSFI